MKSKLSLRAIALVLCALLLVACFPISAAAEEANAITMEEGEIKTDFVPAGTECTSTDKSVAWVDENGNLNALKEGEATISDGTSEYKVTVEDYTDGSETVGNLKIVTRYNDSMQFYDGHVYLIFTSYQDGVEFKVDDLYAGYEISDSYYEDIAKDISAGSNHTGTESDYFSLEYGMEGCTLNRGQVVTIGMYRGFELSTTQAALGAITNSTAWNKLKTEGKTAIIKNIFSVLKSGKTSVEEATAKLKAIFDEVGVDYTKALNGTVNGGVCFNRELFNQKAEWDQYENVTYDLDITANELGRLKTSLNGNLNNFSLFKNSCATVALRAWNAAVGTRYGIDTAYKLSAEGKGIFSIVDAPKGVRDSIVKRLPGYYLNNAQGVEEPGAGYQDDTGWVYVSAPKQVSPVSYKFAEGSLAIDEDITDMPLLIAAAAKGEDKIVYNKDKQEIDVKVNSSEDGDYTVIESVELTVNEKTYTIDSENIENCEFWVNLPLENPDNLDFYAVNDAGEPIASAYGGGNLSVCVNYLPLKIKPCSEEIKEFNTLSVMISNQDEVKAETEVYTKDGPVKEDEEVAPGTTVYVKSTMSPDEYTYVLDDLIVSGESIFNKEHYDADEGAYFFSKPEGYTDLFVSYSEAEVKTKGQSPVQLGVGDVFKITDYVDLEIYGMSKPEMLEWSVVDGADDLFAESGDDIEAKKEGSAHIWVHAKGNENIGVMLIVEVFGDKNETAAITFSDDINGKLEIVQVSDDNKTAIPYSGYLVKKNTVLDIKNVSDDGKAILSLTANDKKVAPGEKLTVSENTEIKASFADAEIQGVPRTIKLDEDTKTYQLNAKIAYKGLNSLKPVYDSSIRYESGDPLVTVDENGLITLAGDIPEDGAAVIVTAYAGSTNDKVSAQTKVIVGDYKGAKIVGKMTIHARRIYSGELTPHGCITFTTYDVVDLDSSYYEFNKPTEKYTELMLDYEKNPEKYKSDPALYNDNELNLENREETYFDTVTKKRESEPETISLKAGESLSVSNYCFAPNHIYTLLGTLEESTLSQIPSTQALIRQLRKYAESDELDGVEAFDSFVATLVQMFSYQIATGKNPADGRTADGGLTIDRELFNQFRRDDSQYPNNYYSVEITADELAAFKSYIANPENNYYSLFTMNCATGAVEIWNKTLADRPELTVKGNYSGLFVDPESLYFELGAMGLKKDIDGEGGKDFYPRSVPYTDEVRNAIAKIDGIGKVEFTDEFKARLDEALEAYNALNDVQKNRVHNYSTLEKAVKEYNKPDDSEKADFDIQKVIETIKALFPNLKDAGNYGELIEEAWKKISEIQFDPSSMIDGAKSSIEGIINKIKEAMGSLFPDYEEEPEPEPTPSQPTIIAPSKVNFSKSPDVKSALNALKKIKSDADPKGSKFNKLRAKSTKVTAKTVKVVWGKVKGAKKYIVVGNKCGNKNTLKKLKTTTATSFTQKKLKKNTNYKYVVLAVNSKNKVITASKVVHVATKGGKKTNYKGIAIKPYKNTVIKKGKTLTLKIAKKVKDNKKGTVTIHRYIKYESANTKIATVTSKGKIKAVKKGSTYIYAYAQNGVYKKIKVTVK